MKEEKSITVYCGSAAGLPSEMLTAARALGAAVAHSGATLVSGAGRTGLMGAVVDGCKSAGGRTIGIIPKFMVERGWANTEVDQLIVTADMHERKQQMLRGARGVIALPGGIGTLEELMEAITWRQLGLYGGNIVIYNICGYYDGLLQQLTQAINDGFMRADHSGLYVVVSDADAAVEAALALPCPTNFSPKF